MEWTGYTPTLTQSGTVTKTVTYAKYTQNGKTVTVTMAMSVTGAGSAGSSILIGLPVTAAAATGNHGIGTAAVVDNSTSTRYTGIAQINSTTTFGIAPDSASGAPNFLGANPSFALASPDSIVAFLTYEAV
jgi:hypothetical protein